MQRRRGKARLYRGSDAPDNHESFPREIVPTKKPGADGVCSRGGTAAIGMWPERGWAIYFDAISRDAFSCGTAKRRVMSYSGRAMVLTKLSPFLDTRVSMELTSSAFGDSTSFTIIMALAPVPLIPRNTRNSDAPSVLMEKAYSPGPRIQFCQCTS